ncbi:MAG: DUF3987 domain-containing protein [Planctomycetes bacterium]|nr:DUF3987 domain-containing protein [Planctomycetota bacterium]
MIARTDTAPPHVAEFLRRLSNVKSARDGWIACCPAHNDQNPSLSIDLGEDDCILLKCRSGGCSTSDIVKAVGLTERDLFAPNNRRNGTHGATRPAPKAAAPKAATWRTPDDAAADLARGAALGGHWRYDLADGTPRLLAVRRNEQNGSKSFRLAHAVPGGWASGGGEKPYPIFGLPKLIENPTARVLFVEGEKCASVVMSFGFTATTTPCGARQASLADLTPLAGRDVVVLPDNDQVGREHAADVAQRLLALQPPARVSVLDLPDLPDKGDVVDWAETQAAAALDQAAVAERLDELLSGATPSTPASHAHDDTDDDTEFRPFPLDVLPPACRSIVEHGARAQGVDPAFWAVPLLSILAGCIGNARRARIKIGWNEPAILWAATIAPSGAGKSPPLLELLRPVRIHDQQLHERCKLAIAKYEADLAVWEACRRATAKEGVTPPERPAYPPMLAAMVEDTTTEALAVRLRDNPRGLLLAMDELAGWVRGFDRYAKSGGGDVQRWLQIHSAGSIKIDRKGNGAAESNRIYVYAAAVSVCGTIQPGVAAKYLLNEEATESGLAARVLLAQPPVVAAKWTDDTIPAAVSSAFGKVVDSLLDLTHDDKEPKSLSMSPEARAAFIEWNNDNGEQSFAAEFAPYASVLSKLRGGAGRFALVLQLARDAESGHAELTQTIGLESMVGGIMLARWFAHEAYRIYSKAAKKQELEVEQQVLQFLATGPLTKTQIRDQFQRNKPGAEVDAALSRLVDQGKVVAETEQTGGRPRTVYRMKDPPKWTD